jgi:hypothetical protein
MSDLDWRRLRIESHDAKERRKGTTKRERAKDAPKTCRYCGVSLKNPARLKRHLRLRHEAERKVRSKMSKKQSNRVTTETDTRPRLRLSSGRAVHPRGLIESTSDGK